MKKRVKLASSLFLLLFFLLCIDGGAHPVNAAVNLQFERIYPYKKVFVNGLINTLEITGCSFVGGTFLGIILAMIKVSSIKFLKMISIFYTSIFRGTPLLVQVFLVYFAVPQLTGYDIPAFNAAVIAFSLNAAAYISEILRGGMESVDRGQLEAAFSLGVSKGQATIDIVIPQALKTVLPAMINETISLLKDSSLVSTIGMIDLMRSSQIAMNDTYLAFEPLIVVALFYYVLVLLLNFAASFLERRLKRSDRD